MDTAAPIDRRLTTILCADVAGYSALMDRDEVGTLRRLRDYRGRMQRLIQRQRGRIANTAGDGILAEFPSAFEAVICAIEVQRELGDCNAGVNDGARMDFRIGINVGDVLVEDGDLFGEGVNVAARLQTLAPPGGILIAGSVHDLVRQKLDVAYDYLGPTPLKNLSENVPIYRVRTGRAGEDEAGPAQTSQPAQPQANRQTNRQDSAPEAASRQLFGKHARHFLMMLMARPWPLAIAALGFIIVMTASVPFVIALWLAAATWLFCQPGMTMRRRVGWQVVALIGFLGALNLNSSPGFPWAIFPGAPLSIAAYWLLRPGRHADRPQAGKG